MDILEKTLRRFSLAKLEALDAIVNSDFSVASTTTVSGTTTRKNQKLGGILSSLARTNIEGNPLVIPAGRSEDGTLWTTNTDVCPKDAIKQLLSKILEENKEYRMMLSDKK